MSAEEAARRVLEVHEPYPQVSESVGPFCPRCLKPYPCDTAIVAQTVLDQQRVLGQVAAALCPQCGRGGLNGELIKVDGKWFHRDARGSGIDSCGLVIVGIDPRRSDIQEALAAWRKEQGQ